MLSGQIGWEHQFARDTRLAELKGSEQSTFFVGHQHLTKLFRHIDSATFMGLGSAEMPHVVMTLHQNETVPVFV